MRRRSAARASRARVSSFSLTSKFSQAVCHSSGETMGDVFTPSPPASGRRRLSPHHVVPLVTERRSQTHRCLSGNATDRRPCARRRSVLARPNALAWQPQRAWVAHVAQCSNRYLSPAGEPSRGASEVSFVVEHPRAARASLAVGEPRALVEVEGGRVSLARVELYVVGASRASVLHRCLEQRSAQPATAAFRDHVELIEASVSRGAVER